MESVEGTREASFDGVLSGKLLGEGGELFLLCGRQEGEEALGGGLFALGDVGLGDVVPDNGVASVNLDEIVGDEQVANMVEVGARRGGVGEDQGEEGGMPGVLGDVFLSVAGDDAIGALNVLEAVRGGDEAGGSRPGVGTGARSYALRE